MKSKFYKKLFFLLIFAFLFFAIGNSVYAATRYVNSDSDGSASHPTLAFDDPAYTPNDSYQTLTAAYLAAVAGDTIEFSGGTDGKSYVSYAGTISKTLTFQGSSINGHNGPVTITRNPNYILTMRLASPNIVLQNLELSGSYAGRILRIDKDNITIKNVVFKERGQGQASYAIEFYTQPTYVTTLTNVIVEGSGNDNGVMMNINTGTANFNNCVINANDYRAVLVSIGATANFTNCAFTNNGTSYYTTFDTDTGTVSTTNSFVQGPLNDPHEQIQAHEGTWNSTDDIINDFPWYNKNAADLGFIAFSTDDIDNNEYFATLANYAMNTYGIPMTFFANETNLISPGDKVNLQTLFKAGHEIGVHTRHHSNLKYTDAFRVTYSGANTDMILTVSGSGTSLSITGTGDTYGPIDLTNASFDTLGELCTDIDEQAKFACSLIPDGADDVLSNSLDDAATNLAVGVATNIPFDDDTGPDNRYYKEEIANAITDLESALHEDPACASYQAKTMAFPYNEANERVIAWVRDNTSLIGARSNTFVGSGFNKSSLSQLNVFNVSSNATFSGLKGSDYDSLTDAEKKSRMERAARVMATYASNGTFVAMLSHYAWQISLQDFTWLLDELVKYRDAYNLNINSFGNIINEVRTSGDWTASSTAAGYYERTFTGVDDFSPRFNSPLIDAGATVAGRTVDVLGNSIYGAPDIGAYEYQPPYAMGVDKIPTTAAVRIYGDEKFRNKTATSFAAVADLSISIPGDDTTQWLDAEISTWDNAGVRHKVWTESSTVFGLTNTIHIVGDLEADKYYNVEVSGVLGQNISGDNCVGGACLSDSQGRITFTYTGDYSDITFNVQEGDNIAPTVLTYSPAKNAAGVATTANLILTFNEAVNAKSGNITIYKSDHTVFETIDVASYNVAGSGTASITINPFSIFNYGTEYYVKIDPTAFDDATGNSYKGINDEITWRFFTVCPDNIHFRDQDDWGRKKRCNK
ncbi:MAG: Ig-like domain-containing protein [Patescibacteria group bacterium]